MSTSWKKRAAQAHLWRTGRNPLAACRLICLLRAVLYPPGMGASTASVPDKLVVLTFDDAVKSHRTFVAPLLKELGYGATSFVTHAWMNDPTNFMTWEEIGEIREMGFGIGNHSWTHADSFQPRNAARLAGGNGGDTPRAGLLAGEHAGTSSVHSGGGCRGVGWECQ